MRNNRATGSRYEQIAALSLSKAGYRIIQQNYRRPTGEIDLIAEDGEYLVFIEVKYRKDGKKGSPQEAVGTAKQARIYRTAQYYLAEHRIAQQRRCRFDVVAIEGNRLRIYRNAFGGL